MRRWFVVLWLGLCSLLSSCPVGAAPTSPVDDAPLRELTQRSGWPEFTQAVQYLERRYLEPALRVREGRLVAQLNEGRLYYLRKDYRQAAMLLLEVVEAYRAQRRRDPLYRDALYYLADAFYYIQNERSA
ncbi:MAG: hypothetical protein VYD19_07600, partial [Myxococcota bacterium]|nr:hypothetical protein [Myxococcota bacterium]